MSQTARLLIDTQCTLGEGPLWHPGRQELFFFDIKEDTLYAANAAGEITNQWLFNEVVAAAAIVDDNTLVLAAETGLKGFDITMGGIAPIVGIEASNGETRTNDSRVHPSGAFWIGTMGKNEETRLASGHCLPMYRTIAAPLTARSWIAKATSGTRDGAAIVSSATHPMDQSIGSLNSPSVR